ncbi:MAG: sigma 54-interacting transcriptional regulator [Kofleriaceae bacterium]
MTPPGIIFASDVMAQLLRDVDIIAENPVPVVLVVGESGTGKQLIARMLHDRSERRDAAFVSLNASTVPEKLVESEFFGYERGAFSDARDRKVGLVEVADGGTLFLDEIGDLQESAQAKLLTFLENQTFRRLGSTTVRQVDVRIVAATNRDLAAMVAAGTFRADLRYRLSPMTIQIPPLRDRPADIGPIAQHFLAEARRDFEQDWRDIAAETLGILETYSWPGNVRELRAVIRGAALFGTGDVLRPEHLPPELVWGSLADDGGMEQDAGGGDRIPTLSERAILHIRRVLAICGGNRTVAAQHLGITRQTLTRRLALEDGGHEHPPDDLPGLALEPRNKNDHHR